MGGVAARRGRWAVVATALGLLPVGLLPLGLLPSAALAQAGGARMPIFDAHLHYSHDAWESVPPKTAIEILRQAGVMRALVSSSNDEGNQMLHAEAPDLILPSLRTYRTRAEVSTWARDETVIPYLQERLKKYRYVAIGEFHLFGADADLPVPRRMVQLAREHNLFLHAHSDVDAIERLFRQWPQARILWAHSGFERPDAVRAVLRRHSNLWADLAFRSEQGTVSNGVGKVESEWRAAFMEFPDRFLVGTDSYVPERWHYVGGNADFSRAWLGDLPKDIAERIGWRNGETLFSGKLVKKQ